MLTKEEKDTIAERLARAITDAYNRTGVLPEESDLKEAILYVLNDSAHIEKLRGGENKI